MKKTLSLLALVNLIFCFGVLAQAQDFGVIAGVRMDSGDAASNSVNAKVESGTGFLLGGIAKFELNAPWMVRTGFIFSQRNYSYKVGNSTNNFQLTYFEVPVGLMWKFSDFGGVFAGPVANFNVAKKCGDLDCAEVGSPLGFQVGGSFKFAPQLGFEFYYEQMFSKMEARIENPKGIGANFMIAFD